MYKTGLALLVKFILTLVAAIITFGFTDRNTLSWVLAFSLVATVINYFIGDLGVLPAFGNSVAAVGDGVLSIVTAYLMNLLFPDFKISLITAISFGLLIAVGEHYFHKYLDRLEKVSP